MTLVRVGTEIIRLAAVCANELLHGAVYHAAAGLAPGLLPYRDFLFFLHPQSIVRSDPAEES
jgi:hypothetical protein